MSSQATYATARASASLPPLGAAPSNCLPPAATAAPRRSCSRMVLASSRVVELVRAGLPTMHTDRIVDGGRTLEVARVKVNDAGRQALA